MITTQQKFLDYLDSVKNELKPTNFDTATMDNLSRNIADTELVVPVIGNFSAGKSSLLNSFLGKEVLDVDITPTTGIATELRFSQDEYSEWIDKDGRIERKEIWETSDNSGKYRFLRLYLNKEPLKNIEPLILVDMPGFDSPLDIHNRAIVEYIAKGVHYVVLSDCTEGSVTKNMMREISNIRAIGKDFSFFLSKSDLKSQGDINKIAEYIKEQFKDEFDISKEIVPITQNDGKTLEKILKEIDSEKLFRNLFADEVRNCYFEISDKINTYLKALKNDKDINENAIAELQKGITELVHKKENIIAEIKEKYSDVQIERIVNAVGSDLSRSIEELVSLALSGSDKLQKGISDIIRTSIVKHVSREMEETALDITEKIADSLKNLELTINAFSAEETADWLDKISKLIEVLLGSSGSSNSSKTPAKLLSNNALYKTITSVVAITTSILNPIQELIILFLPEIIKLISYLFGQDKQKENIRNKLLTEVIPNIKREIYRQLEADLPKHVETLIEEISKKFEEELRVKKATISAAEEEKRKQCDSVENEIGKYENILTNIKSLTTQYEIF